MFQLITSKTLSANFGSNLFPASNYIITISQMALLRFRFTPKYTLSYTHTKSVCLSASCTQWFSHISFILRKNCLWDQLADIEVVVLDGGAWIAELYHTRLWISVHWAMPWGCEFEPQWWQTLFWTQAQHLHFFHDSIWFIWFDTNYYLSIDMRFVKWKWTKFI